MKKSDCDANGRPLRVLLQTPNRRELRHFDAANVLDPNNYSKSARRLKSLDEESERVELFADSADVKTFGYRRRVAGSRS